MREIQKNIQNLSSDKFELYNKIMNCSKPNDFKNLAVKLGANVRDQNHIFIKHFNGDVTSISCTPGKKYHYLKHKMNL